MRIKIAVILAAALTLSGCVETIAEDRVRTALLDAGVPPGDAGCMSERMVDRLSIDQLKRLEALKARTGEAERPRTLGEFVERIRRVGDDEVVAVTASSAALCATGLAAEAS